MPSSYPSPFEAAPTTVRSKGLVITQQESINGNVVTQTYTYNATDPIWMPADIEAKIDAINSGKSVELPKP